MEFLSCFGNKDYFVFGTKSFIEIGSEQKIKDFLRAENPTVFIWDRKMSPIINGEVDLKEIYNQWGFDTIEKVAKDLPSLTLFLHYKNKLFNILNTFEICNIAQRSFRLVDLVPQSIITEYIQNSVLLLKDIVSHLEQHNKFQYIINYYRDESPFDVIRKMKYSIETTQGARNVNLNYAANFRFKPSNKTFNLFNLPTHQRDIIIPQDEKSFIYNVDFRQFEFRTFCLLSGNKIDFENRDLYREIGNVTNTSKEDIIAYMYGKYNSKLNEMFPRQNILDKIVDGIYWYNKIPLLVQEEDISGIKIHTIVQTYSYLIYLERLKKVLNLLENKKSKFIFPLHDSMIFSINKDEIDLIEEIRKILTCDIYKIKEYIGKNLRDIKEI